MFEKVNPAHPDKVADRIAGAIVDLAYAIENNPRIAVEVLIGHGRCNIIAESSVKIDVADVEKVVERIVGQPLISINYREVPQDIHLAKNQFEKIRCGDNGIFKGVPKSYEQEVLSKIAHDIYERHPYDGKYVINRTSSEDCENRLIICQSNVSEKTLKEEGILPRCLNAEINPLGDWTGGLKVDSGATNRKLGSDMGDSVTGGGLHGKDLSKADVSINIYAWLKAQETQCPVYLCCAIGDEKVDGKPYSEIVEIARGFIREKGGFEKFAEWGLI